MVDVYINNLGKIAPNKVASIFDVGLYHTIVNISSVWCKHQLRLYMVSHGTLPVVFFFDSLGMPRDIEFKFCIGTL